MRFLILGNPESFFLHNWLLKILENFPVANIKILSSTSTSFDYGERVKIIEANKNSIIERIPKIRSIYSIYKKRQLISNFEFFNICHVHFVETSLPFLSYKLSCRCRKIITSVWGSDFYRSSYIKRRTQEKLLRISDIITFTNQETLKDFDNYYNKKYTDKLRVCRFGLAPLDKLKKLKIEKTNGKKELGISPGEIVITIGYNNSPAQQHISILRAIHNHKKQLPENILFLLPMTYGSTKKYTNAIRDEINKLGFKYKIFDKYLSDKEIAIIRKATDIMIQTQKTDQFSGSMQEHIYAENVVITGDWLPYRMLDEKGVFMLKVSSVDEVGKKLVYALNNLDSLKEKCKKNPEIIWELSSWEKNIQSWIDMYGELLQKER